MLFCPYPDHYSTGQILDMARVTRVLEEILDRQEEEFFTFNVNNWNWFASYTSAMLTSLSSRGYKIKDRAKADLLYSILPKRDGGWQCPWDNFSFHKSHRVELYRRDPELYSMFKPEWSANKLMKVVIPWA